MKTLKELKLDHTCSISSFLVLQSSNENIFYTGINDWNALPNSIKEIKSEDMFKEKLKMHLMKEMENDEKKQFTKR